MRGPIGGGRGSHGDYGGRYVGYQGMDHKGVRENKKDKFPNYLDHKPPEDDPLATRTLFTGNLELNITEEEMRRIFGRYGRLVDIDIKRPPPGTGNAYAFIRFENLDQAHRAKVELSGQYIGKFQCKIGYGKVNATPKVWIGGLGSWTSVSLLEREFDRFGAIQKIEYNKGDPHAFIFYESLEAAQAAVQQMRGFPLGGPDKRIRIDYSDLEDYSGGSHPGSRRDDPDYDHHYGSSARGGGRGRYPYPSRGRGGGGYGRDLQAGYDDHHSRPRHRGSDRRSPPESDDFSPPDHHQHKMDAKNVSDLARTTTKAWEGELILKKSLFPSKLYLVEGSRHLAEQMKDEQNNAQMTITQRLKLDQSKLDDVSRRLSTSSSHAVFLCMTSTHSLNGPMPEGFMTRPLKSLIVYLKEKNSAGVISLPNLSGVLYCFPPCTFSFELLQREAPFVAIEEGREDHLVILVVCGDAN